MNETGFGRRKDYKQYKSCLIQKTDDSLFFYRGETDFYHISVVYAMTASCTYLPPLLLSKKKKLDQDISNTFFNHWGKLMVT